MRIIALLCLLLVSYASAKQQFSELQYRNAFTNWMIQHQRHYSSEEFATRYNIFKSNMDYVNEWNTKGSETVLGLNVFADITNEEYRNTYLGTPFDASDLIGTQAEKVFGVTSATVDWRTKGAVTPIKNQGQCGGCWSFSTTGSTEGAHQIATGNLVSLSEQNLIDCSLSYGNQGCDGGLMTLAFEYIINNKGIDTEASYPYTAETGKKCKYNPNKSGATLSSYTNVTSGSETSLASAANVNPVSVAIDASHNSFQLYSSGIYYEPACSTTQLDHGVLVVGYGSGSLPSTGSSSSSSGQSSSSSSSSQSGSQSGSQASGSQASGSQASGSQSGASSGSQASGSQASGSGSASGQASGSGSASGQASGSGSGSGSQSGQVEASNGNYWIVKNSWGTSWGVEGYIFMSKDRNNNCGISTMASFPKA